MRAYPRERFSSEIRFTPDVVTAYAHAGGDTNPVHHDQAWFASETPNVSGITAAMRPRGQRFGGEPAMSAGRRTGSQRLRSPCRARVIP
jgi:acyl dehydratase